MGINILFPFFSMLLLAKLGGGQNQCRVSRCSHGPAIRFPFRLKDQQPEHCGYPGFELSCNNKKQTVLELPKKVKVLIKKIDYTSQLIHIYDDRENCLPRQLPNLNLSVSPFHFKDVYLSGVVLFNCSAPDRDQDYEINLVPCLGVPGYQVYAVSFSIEMEYYDLTSCTKIANISSFPDAIFYHGVDFQLHWSTPNCGRCEAEGKICSFKNTTVPQPEIQCSDKPKTTQDATSDLLITGAVLEFFFLVGVPIFVLYRLHTTNKMEKENQLKIEKFLEDYRVLKPTRYSYADIKKITNQFKDKLGQGGYGTVFKGKLSNEILVAVKVLNSSTGKGDDFINEVGTIGRIHHVNVVRLVGFCADGFRRVLVYEFLPNDSLQKFLVTENHSLGWEKLQDIALGIAKGIEYLHQGCDQRILHFDIKPHNILLDHNFNPKVSDFGLAKLCSKEQSAVSMTAARGTIGYIAPEVFSRNFGNVSYKSDVYSFGMLLLDMVGVRKKDNVTVEDTSQTYFPQWIYNRLRQGEELGMHIEEEEHAKIAKKLTIVGLWCIQWYPVDRPAMNTIVQMLEGEGDTLTVPPSPFASTIQMNSSTMPARAFETELEVISESE